MEGMMRKERREREGQRNTANVPARMQEVLWFMVSTLTPTVSLLRLVVLLYKLP